MRAQATSGDEAMGKAIRTAITHKIPNVLVLGQREVDEGQVTLRRYGSREQETMAAQEFRERLRTAIAGRRRRALTMTTTVNDPIAAVVARMEAVAASLPASDGVAAFNHLYLEVTLAVDSTAHTPAFEDTAFLSALDVIFAGLYFSQLDASGQGQPLRRSWAPLFAARSDRHIAAIQFAVAGMNAHINHDLCLALVSACEARGIALSSGSPQHRDYLKVNAILSAVEAKVKSEYLTGLLGVADEVLGQIDNVLAMWSITEARNAAWCNAETLWRLRQHGELTTAFEDALDGTVGFASRGLLTPTLP